MSQVVAVPLANSNNDRAEELITTLCFAVWDTYSAKNADPLQLETAAWSWPRIVVCVDGSAATAWSQAWQRVLMDGHEALWLAPVATISEYRHLPALPWAQRCPAPDSAPFVLADGLWISFLSTSAAARKRFTAGARQLGVFHSPRTQPTFVDIRARVLAAIKRDASCDSVTGARLEAIRAIRDSLSIEDMVEAGATEQAVEKIYGRRLSPEESAYRAQLIIERRRTPQPMCQRDVTERVREEIQRMQSATLTEMIDCSRRWLDTCHNENARRIKVNRALLALERSGMLKVVGDRGGAKVRACK